MVEPHVDAALFADGGDEFTDEVARGSQAGRVPAEGDVRRPVREALVVLRGHNNVPRARRPEQRRPLRRVEELRAELRAEVLVGEAGPVVGLHELGVPGVLSVQVVPEPFAAHHTTPLFINNIS